MGYSTDFNGQFNLSRPATKKQMKYINEFVGSRRMKRDPIKLMELYNGKHGHPTPITTSPEGIYGPDGEYFARIGGDSGQSEDVSIIDFNTPPGQPSYNDIDKFKDIYKERRRRSEAGECQPSLWCKWELSDNETLQWDFGEKFDEYILWVKYLINHFFEPWGIKLNGEVEWSGDELDDRGKIVVKDNDVKIMIGTIVYKEE